MKKIAIYTRVSTKEQTTQNQVLTLTAFAEKNGWEYEIFEETESSRKSRPIKASLLNRIRNNEFDGVLIQKLDRWARSSTELILEISELIKRNIEFHSYSENIDFTTATGKLHFTILSAFAEFERELIRERTLEGLKRAKTQGKVSGRPFGSKDKAKRRTEGYFKQKINNPPLNNTLPILHLQN